MAGLDIVSVQDAIAAYIRSEFSAYEVYEDELIDNEAILKVGNKVKPYITLRWGGLFETGRKAISGARYDEYISTVDVNVIAPTPRQARRALNIITDKLVGWKIDDIAPMTLQGGAGTYTIPDLNGVPHVYMSTIRFQFPVNYTDPGAPIAP